MVSPPLLYCLLEQYSSRFPNGPYLCQCLCSFLGKELTWLDYQLLPEHTLSNFRIKSEGGVGDGYYTGITGICHAIIHIIVDVLFAAFYAACHGGHFGAAAAARSSGPVTVTKMWQRLRPTKSAPIP